MAARSLFSIENVDSIEDISLRDLKPVVMFQIRQLIEIYGKNIIGYRDIKDLSRNPVKKFTQVSWEFLAIEIVKQNSNIKLPFDIRTIICINS